MHAYAPLNALFRLTLTSGVAAAVSLHLRRGAPLNGRDAKGRTPLILAAARGHVDVCQLLLDAGADVDLQDGDGRTALAAAQGLGHASVAALILEFKAKRRRRQDLDDPPVDSIVPVPCDMTSTSQDASLPEHATCTAEYVQHPDVRSDGLQVSGPGRSLVDDGFSPEAGEEGWGEGWLADDAGPDDSQSGHALSLIDPPLPGANILPAPSAEVHVAPPPAFEPDGPSWDVLWEPEPEPMLTLVETGMEAAAAALQHGLTRHQASTADTDWTVIDVDLPEMVPIWATGFSEDFDARRTILDLLATALHEGWLPAEHLKELTDRALNNQRGISVERALRSALDGMGVLIEDEHALELSRDRSRTYVGESRERKSEVDSGAQFLADLSTDELDAETMLVEDAGHACVLSALEEGILFRRLHRSLATMLRVAATEPSTAAILNRWAEQLTAGRLAVRDISTSGLGGSDTELPASPGAEIRSPVAAASGEEETDTPAEPVHNDEIQDIQALASRLDEAAYRISLGNAPALVLGSLDLTGRRIVELAESVLHVTGRAPRRATPRSRTSARDRVSELHLLRGRAAARSSALPDHEISVALDAYISARQAIVEGNLRRVVWNARRYSRGPVPFLDLVQEGQIGLLKAIDRFDVERGARFGTYATWWIRQSIHRAMQDTGSTIRIPVHMRDRMAKIRRRSEAFKVRHGVEPTPADVASDMEVDVRVVQQALSADREVVSLDMGDDDAFEEQDGYLVAVRSATSRPVDPATPLSAVLHADLRHRLLDALGRLDPRQARILDLRFGITSGEPMTLEEVGQLYGVTRERIRQVEAKALGRMPRLLPRHGFENMLP